MTDEHFEAWRQLAAAMDESLDGVRANYQDLVKIMDNTPLPTQLMADIAMATPALRSLIQSMLTTMARQVAYVRRASRRKRLRYRPTVSPLR